MSTNPCNGHQPINRNLSPTDLALKDYYTCKHYESLPQAYLLYDEIGSPYGIDPNYDRRTVFHSILQSFEEGEFSGEEYKIFPIIEEEAHQGDTWAQEVIAKAFLYGNGKPKDIDKAIYWLEKANSGEAQYILACLKEKAGGTENIKQAITLFVRSSSNRYIKALFDLGRICYKGIIIPINSPAALYCYVQIYRNFPPTSEIGAKSKAVIGQILTELKEENWQIALKKYFPKNLFLHGLNERSFIHLWILAKLGLADYQNQLDMYHQKGLLDTAILDFWK